MPYEHMLQSNRIGVLLSTILNQIQWTLVVATLFVTKDLAVKSNLLLKRNDMDPSKVWTLDTFEQFLYESYVLCIC